MRKVLLFSFIILLLISIYKDITVGTNLYKNQNIPPQVEDHIRFQPIKVKVNTGDTLLGIIEEINTNLNQEKLDVNRIISDFQSLNPNTDPYSLKANSYYYFPLYH